MGLEETLNAVVFAQWGEAIDHHPSGSSDPVRVALAVWGSVEKSDLGQGFVADTSTVQIRATDLVQYGSNVIPARDEELNRYPDEWTSGLRETWRVDYVRRPTPAVWELEVIKDARPVPNGAGWRNA